jgi:hypothetical protein
MKRSLVLATACGWILGSVAFSSAAVLEPSTPLSAPSNTPATVVTPLPAPAPDPSALSPIGFITKRRPGPVEGCWFTINVWEEDKDGGYSIPSVGAKVEVRFNGVKKTVYTDETGKAFVKFMQAPTDETVKIMVTKGKKAGSFDYEIKAWGLGMSTGIAID